jgi:hypothetical protein
MLDDRTTLIFPRTGTAAAPFDFAAGMVCCQAAGPGGHPLHVLVDTGTDPSAVDVRLARRLALPTGGSGLGQGAASDAVAFTEAVLPWLRLGELQIRDLFAPALDLRVLPFPVDVVLGYNVLRQLALRIDYQRGVLLLAHPDVGAPAGGEELPLRFFEHFPALHGLEVDGRALPLATIDTGSNAAITLGPGLAGEFGLRPGAAGVTAGEGAGFGGRSRVLRRRCGAVRLGPFRLEDVELDAQLGAAGDLARAGRANIGNRLLARFAAVSLDYSRGVLGLRPRDP